jgi:hypothetical protein
MAWPLVTFLVVVKFKMSRCDLLANANSRANPTAKMVVDQTSGP